jgi:hypothetical protein
MGPVFIGPCLHPCMKDFGYGHQARPDTRLCGAFRMLITAQSRINDVRLLTARPFAPDRATLAPCSLPSRRGLATTELVVTTSRRPALTAAARGAFEILAGRDEETAPGRTKKLSQEGHDAHGPVINPSIGARGTRSLLPDRRSLLTVPIQGWAKVRPSKYSAQATARAPRPRGSASQRLRVRTARAKRAFAHPTSDLG